MSDDLGSGEVRASIIQPTIIGMVSCARSTIVSAAMPSKNEYLYLRRSDRILVFLNN